MNRDRAIFHLHEIASDIPGLIAEIEQGRYDEDGDLSYEVALAHLLDHLSLAWHQSRMTDNEVAQLSQEQFEQLCTAIPRLQLDMRLVDTWEKVV
ncbi:MAG: hypothetical protein GC162_14225 [Planctomycetes bacterium]|nr:hypothetical protein [Planctomycetota bacterium]